MFKKRRGIKVPYNKQGYIYFTCMNLAEMPQAVQQKVLALCMKIGGEYHEALYALLTDDTRNVHAVALEYRVSETQLYAYRKKFYEQWEE